MTDTEHPHEPPRSVGEALEANVRRLADAGVDRLTLRTYDGGEHVVNLATGEHGVDAEDAERAVRAAIDAAIDRDLSDEQRAKVQREFENVVARTFRERHEKRIGAEQRAVAMRLFPVENAPGIVKSTFKLKKAPTLGEIDSEGDVTGPARAAVASGAIDPVDLVHLPIGSRVRLEIDAYVVGFNPTAELEDEEGRVRDGKIDHVLNAGRVRILSIRRTGERAARGDVKIGPKVVNLPELEDEDGHA